MRHLALLALLAALLLAPGPARADPALFIARAPDLTAYLFGSVHALRPGTAWLTPALRGAIGASSECWFEVVTPHDALDIPDSMQRGIDSLAHLPALLSRQDLARIKRRADALHIPGGGQGFTHMQPWFAAFVLQPEPAMLRLLHERLASTPSQGTAPNDATTDALVQAWIDGDIDIVAERMNQPARRLGPILYGTLVLKRNQAWAARLDTMRGADKTILVTVGAGHLAGPGNLRDLLSKKGFTVVRTQ